MDKLCVRYQVMNNKEKAPYATACKVVKGYDGGPDEEASFYIQISKNEEKPNWIPIGSFLEGAFKDMFEDETFLDECLRLYEKLDTAS